MKGKVLAIAVALLVAGAPMQATAQDSPIATPTAGVILGRHYQPFTPDELGEGWVMSLVGEKPDVSPGVTSLRTVYLGPYGSTIMVALYSPQGVASPRTRYEAWAEAANAAQAARFVSPAYPPPPRIPSSFYSFCPDSEWHEGAALLSGIPTYVGLCPVTPHLTALIVVSIDRLTDAEAGPSDLYRMTGKVINLVMDGGKGT